METSLLHTLANKHKSKVTRMANKYKATTETPYEKRKCLRVVIERTNKKPLIAQFGGIPLRRQKTAILVDSDPTLFRTERNELLKRLLADKCEICGATEKVEVHHIRKLADLKIRGRKEPPVWIKQMAARKRKTLMVCHNCHQAIHAGVPSTLLKQVSRRAG